MHMQPTSLAALRAALADDRLDLWLAAVPDAARERLRSALAIDRPLRDEHPESLASCLLARSFGDPACADLHAAWQRELDDAATPWIRPLRALPVPHGLLAELREGSGITFTGLQRPAFLGDDELVLTAIRFHPSVQDPALRRRERIRWSWRRGELVTEPDPHADEPTAPASWPRITTDGWGPAYLQRTPDAARVALPCPADGSAEAHFSADGARLIVYGTLDEYAGGFVWIVDPDTLTVERKLAMAAPITAVVGTDPDRLIVTTHRTFSVAWIDGHRTSLDLGGDALCLSPDGQHVASLGDGLQVWSLAELVRHVGTRPRAGFPPRFDPDGERLLCGPQLLDARTGAVIAELEIDGSGYLEGGPAQPWLHFGARHLACSHGGLHLWDARSGAPRKLHHRISVPHWNLLAYDRAALHLAVLRRGHSTVDLHELPNGRLLRTLHFELEGGGVAMSPDASMIAIHHGPALELRDQDGALRLRLGTAPADRPDDRYGDETLRFSSDGLRVARRVDEQWHIATLATGVDELVATLDDLPDLADPHPPDWTLAVTTCSLFTHTPTGTRIALPLTGPWVFNPADPRIAACPTLHAVLHAP
jgi:hypothetical protein